MLEKLRDAMIMFKIYFGRSQSYLAIINASMILFLTLTKLKDMGITSIDLSSYFIALCFLGFFLLLFIGWVEVKYIKGLHKEQQFATELNPFMTDMKAKLDYLYQKEMQDETNKNKL